MNDKELQIKEDEDIKNHKSKLDHIIIASPDLKALVLEFYRLTGVKPVEGGQHEGKGTANYLIGLGKESYIELIGPDPTQKDPAQSRPLRVDEISKTTVVGWAVRPDDMDNRIRSARKRGYDPGDPKPMSRKTPAGEELKWILTPLSGGLGGTIPFLIDWKDTKHPSYGLPAVRLVSLTLTHPQSEKVRSALEAIKALDLVTEICEGEIGMEIEIDTPKGRVQFS